MPQRRAAADSRNRIAPRIDRSVDHAVERLESRTLMARTPGIDISHWQGAKTVAQLTQTYNDGKRFMFHKATEGTDYLDPNAAGNIANARTAGLLVGVYHFARPDTNSAVTEANWFISQATQWATTSYLRPVLDLEDGASLSPAALSTWVNTWCTTVQNALGIDPIIYTNTNYATNELDSSVNTHPLWLANWQTSMYGDPITGTGNPPDGVWNGWKFWQYDDSGTVAGFSSPIDVDVYNGDLLSLQQNFIIGTVPAKPATPSPANGATGVNRNGLVLNWADSANATSYDVYLDGVLQTNVATSQWTPPTLSQGAHNWQIAAKNAAGTVLGDLWTFNVAPLGVPSLPANPFPANNAIVTSTPITLDWDDSTNATSYQIWSGASLVGTTTTSQFGPISPLEGNRPWKIVALNAENSSTGPQWTFTVDKTPPTATYGNQTPTTGATTFNFTVAYADAFTSVDTSTFDNSDVTVTGPNGFSANATYISRVGNVATYQIAAPGGTWNPADAGLYTVSQNGSQVSDTAGWSRPAGAIGTFTAAMPYAYVTGSTLHIEFPAAPNNVIIGSDGNGNTTTDENGSVLSFATNSFSDVVVHGTSGDDSVTLSATLSKPITFDGQTGQDTLTLASGVTHIFASDAGALCSDLTIVSATGASAFFNATQHLGALIVDGNATITEGGAKVLVLGELTVSGTLDVYDNDIIVNYTGASPLGSWNGSEYDGINGLIHSGSNGGLWEGIGIRSSSAASAGGLTVVAAGEASQVLGVGAGATDLWNGETVDSTTVIIKYTFSGDADLNGELNGDDYFYIDSHVLQSGTVFGFNVGDFDLNGEINGDDYFLLDAYILQASGQVL